MWWGVTKFRSNFRCSIFSAHILINLADREQHVPSISTAMRTRLLLIQLNDSLKPLERMQGTTGSAAYLSSLLLHQRKAIHARLHCHIPSARGCETSPGERTSFAHVSSPEIMLAHFCDVSALRAGDVPFFAASLCGAGLQRRARWAQASNTEISFRANASRKLRGFACQSHLRPRDGRIKKRQCPIIARTTRG